MTNSSDTIFALATPPGKSAVQIIRISGSGAARALRRLTGTVPKPRNATYATIKDNSGIAIDQALVLFFQSPSSATGEDTAEIQLHGSPVLGRIVMEQLESMINFRLADPGEFTRRAFMNGKINLDQAEGIADIIDANTVSQHRQAMRQLDGALSRQTDEWREVIIRISAELAALIDFADEDLPDHIAQSMRDAIDGLMMSLNTAISTANQGLIRRDGVRIALVGKPNAGKSTLLNHLIGDDRAIVSPEAGTTRDLVDVSLDINGVFVTLMDTAGLRKGAGVVETEGVKRAIKAAQNAHLVLLLVEATEPDPVAAVSRLTADLMSEQGDISTPRIVPIITKSDQITSGQVLPEWPVISVHQGKGLAALDSRIHEEIAVLLPENEAPVLTRQRHLFCVKQALEALNQARLQDPHHAPELMAEDLRRASTALGRISGHVDVEDLLDHIFSSFCIGK